MLEINNLCVSLKNNNTLIIKDLSLIVPKGEVHAIMGPNGSGKSTLAHVIAGKDGYEVTDGEIIWNGTNILNQTPEERAAFGVFLAFQYPMEVPGVAGLTFLRTAMNAIRRKNDQETLTTPQFMRLVKQKSADLHIDMEMLKRPVNVGFSGGEKKRAEILQMAMLAPSLDIDALKIVSEGVNTLRGADRTMLVITHYQRLLDYIIPNKVHVLANGQIKGSGDKNLALKLEKSGYTAYAN